MRRCAYRCKRPVFTRRSVVIEGGGVVVLSLCHGHARFLSGAEV